MTRLCFTGCVDAVRLKFQLVLVLAFREFISINPKICLFDYLVRSAVPTRGTDD